MQVAAKHVRDRLLGPHPQLRIEVPETQGAGKVGCTNHVPDPVKRYGKRLKGGSGRIRGDDALVGFSWR